MLHRLGERPGTAANVGLGVVFAAALTVEAGPVEGGHGGLAFPLAVGTAVCVAALLRERSRARAAAAGLAVCAAAELASWQWHLPSQPGAAAALALLVLIGSAVRVLPFRPAAAIAAGGAAVTAGTLERYLTFIADGTPNNLTATRLMGLGWAVAVGTGLWLRLLDGRRQVAIEAVRRGERLELARELHDAAAHHITGIVLQAQAARIAARKHAETLDDALAGIESAGTEALASMRQVIGLLRDSGDAGGLTPGPEQVTELVERFAGRGPAVRLRLPDGHADPAWPPEVTTTVCRVVQEALTNITRHAPGAGEVTVALAHDRQAITVEITDDAPPAGSPRFPHAGGYGLIGMRERVEALGGTLTAGPGPGAGWSVLATLPAPGRP
ncbi:sensor histidine kinase [Actinomadura sp. HBU206391]|nr:sensor histidine kinase [Actinomadura sp. HBU206391]